MRIQPALIVAALTLAAANDSSAQGQPLGLNPPMGVRIAQNGAPASSPPAPSSTSPSDYESLLQQLQATTGRVSQQLVVPVAPPKPIVSPSPMAPTIANAVDDEETTQRNEDVSRIRERIQLLRKLRSKLPANEPAAPPNQGPSLSPMPQVVDLPTRPDPNIQAIEENLATPPLPANTTSEVVPPPADMEAKEIVSGPVNSLALGQSLYRTKNYEAALKAFNNVSVETMEPADRSWLELMKAMCHRRLNKTPDSEAILRTLANDKSGEYPVIAARWWLKHSESVSDSQPIFDETSASIERLLERANKHVQAN